MPRRFGERSVEVTEGTKNRHEFKKTENADSIPDERISGGMDTAAGAYDQSLYVLTQSFPRTCTYSKLGSKSSLERHPPLREYGSGGGSHTTIETSETNF